MAPKAATSTGTVMKGNKVMHIGYKACLCSDYLGTSDVHFLIGFLMHGL